MLFPLNVKKCPEARQVLRAGESCGGGMCRYTASRGMHNRLTWSHHSLLTRRPGPHSLSFCCRETG